MLPRFEQFIRERQYISNVTPATVAWYRNSLKWLPSESPTQEQLKDMVMRMREKGLKATGCNCVIRAVNAYLHWNTDTEQKCGPGCPHVRVARVKEPDLVLPTFTASQVTRIVKWKPKRKVHQRFHLLMLLLLDTGCRISEALTLRVCDVDMDNLLITVTGKGRKQRVIPFSFELRRVLCRYTREVQRKPDWLLFASRDGTALEKNNVRRAVKLLCKRLGFDPPERTLHALRHTFAVNYLRRGGSVFHLQKVLGHSTLEMTRRYANLMTEDLQAVHERVSLLSR